MGKVTPHRLAFNRGLTSPRGLARADIQRLAFAAAQQENWVSRVLGSMSLRPGWGYLGATRNDNEARFIPFIFSLTQKALVEFTNATMRVWLSDAVLTRPSVSTAITNGTFTTDLTGWTDNDQSGGVSAWLTGGYMDLAGNGTGFAIREQQVTIAAADQHVEHGVRIVVSRGPVLFRAGTTTGAQDLFASTSLEEGTHSLAITPTTAAMFLEFKSLAKRKILVDSCEIEASGVVEIPAVYTTAQLDSIRFAQTGDVIFLSADGPQQHKVERRATRSWSFVKYLSEVGPFFTLNTGTVTITPSAISGNITLTASQPIFKESLVGGQFALTSAGQLVSVQVTAENTFSDPILIEGVGTQRAFTITRTALTGTGTTITLQRSFTSDAGPWEDVTTYTTTATVSLQDAFDNSLAWYRIGCKTGGYSTGTIDLSLATVIGAIRGITRVTGFTSELVLDAEVLKDLGGIAATRDWQESQWSDFRGWPTAVEVSESRLMWAGRDSHWGSVTDQYYNFDDLVVGDSGTIHRSIGFGAVDTINWLMTLDQLIMGAQLAELTAKSTNFQEPMTPTNTNIRRVSGQGSANVSPEKIDATGIFVQRGGVRVYEVGPDDSRAGYGSTHLSALYPEIGSPGIVRMASQRQPDTRVHFVRSNGTVALLIFDPVENVICWGDITTDGLIEDVVVLPGNVGDSEDYVYYVVKRTINGADVRYLERWAFETECEGGTLNKQADSFIEYTQIASATITGLGHLEGEAVVVWDNGICLADADGDIAEFTVASGQITVTNRGAAYDATNGIVGKTYTAPWKSSKFVELYTTKGLDLSSRSVTKALALIMDKTHAQGVKFGADFDNLDPMPGIEGGAVLDPDTIHDHYAEEEINYPGILTNDNRLCLQAQAPRPATILAAIVHIEAFQ